MKPIRQVGLTPLPALAAAWALFALWLYFSRCWVGWKYLSPAFDATRFPVPPWPVLGANFLALLKGPLAAFVSAVTFLFWGGRLRRWVALPAVPVALAAALDFALGSILLNLFWVGAGFLNLWRGGVVWIACLGLALPALGSLPRLWADRNRERTPSKEAPLPLEVKALVGLGALMLFWVFLHSLLPDLFYDSNTYHLALPALWKSLGGFREVQGNVFSQYPFGGEMVFVNGFWFASDEGAKGLQPYLLAALALAAYGWAREGAGRLAGALAAGWILTFQLLVLNACNTQVEVLWSLYNLLAFWAADRYLRDFRTGHGAAAALLACASLAVKDAAVVPLAAGGLALALTHAGERADRIFPRRLILFAAAVMALTAGPWIVRNSVQSGNPLAPYAVQWFGGDNMGEAGRARLMAEQHDFTETGIWEKFLWPVPRMTRLGDAADFGGPFLLACLPLMLLLLPMDLKRRWVHGAWVAAFLGGGMVTHVLRFHAPALTLGWVLLAMTLAERGKAAVRVGAAVAALCAVLTLGALANISAVHASGAGVWSLREGRGAYLSRAGDTPTGDLVQVAGKAVAPGEGILVVGDGRSLHFPQPAWAQSVFDRQVLAAWAQEGAGSLPRELKRLGVEWVALPGREAARRNPDYHLLDLTPEEGRRMSEGVRTALAPVAVDRWGGFYRVKDGNTPPTVPLDPHPFELLCPPGAAFLSAYGRGDWAQAGKALDHMILYFPKDPHWWETRARMKMKAGDRRGAEEDLKGAARLGGLHADSLGLLKELEGHK